MIDSSYAFSSPAPTVLSWKLACQPTDAVKYTEFQQLKLDMVDEYSMILSFLFKNSVKKDEQRNGDMAIIGGESHSSASSALH